MSKKFELKAQLRTDVGKGASRRLRKKASMVPSIIYGANKDPVMISLDHDSILHATEKESFFSQILDMNIGDDDR